MANPSRYDNYIGGQWLASSDYSRNINPSDLSDVVGEYAQAARTNDGERLVRTAHPTATAYCAPWASISAASMAYSSASRSVSGARTGPASCPTIRAPALMMLTP